MLEWSGRLRPSCQTSSLPVAIRPLTAGRKSNAPIHLWFASTSLGFSLPAASFRYYLPLWPPLAHAVAFGVAAERGVPWRRASLVMVSFAALAVGWLSP